MSRSQSLDSRKNTEARAQEIVASATRQNGGRVVVPLPRPARHKKKSRADRGLAPPDQLADLVRTYLERQRRHWPEIVQANLLPEPTNAVIQEMVADFQQRHRGNEFSAETARRYLRFSPKLGGAYGRYSCDNSNPLSVADQLVKILDKARSEDRFIPWTYVFADYSVTGLDASRQGYTSYKAALAAPEQLIETTFVDDFSRASRDELEWWRLAALSKKLGKRMIGASDGFDLNGPNWDVMVTVFGLLSRLFIKSLKQKVTRGMRGGARRGNCLGKLALGFTRRAKHREDGSPIVGPDGAPVFEPCVDEATAEYRRLMFDLYVNQSWSLYRITKHFNQIGVDGWKGWTVAAVQKLLRSPTAIGIFIWNRTRRELDCETNSWKVLKNPRQEWEVYKSSELAIVPQELWRAARRRLAASRRGNPLTGRKVSRNQVSATTLFSGTLFCTYCGAELKLARSTKKHKQISCLNGVNGAFDCKLKCSKSLAIIEDSILKVIHDQLLSEEQVAKLVKSANESLKAQAKQPRIDVKPLKAKESSLLQKIRRLVTKIEDTDDKELSAGYHGRVQELQRELNEVRRSLAAANATTQKSVQPISLEWVREQLGRLRGLLQQDIPIAAQLLRKLTGPIKIRQEPIAGRERGARWIATFTPNILESLLAVGGDGKPLLKAGASSAPPAPVEVVIEKVPQYERWAPEFLARKRGGASVASIAAAHGTTFLVAKQVLHFAETGERPKSQPGKRTGKGGKETRYIEIAKEVAHKRDVDKMSFAKLAKHFGVSKATISRAYDHARPEAVRTASETGTVPRRGSYSHLGEPKKEQIRKLLQKGVRAAQVAEKVGCGASTVYRVTREMKS